MEFTDVTTQGCWWPLSCCSFQIFAITHDISLPVVILLMWRQSHRVQLWHLFSLLARWAFISLVTHGTTGWSPVRLQNEIWNIGWCILLHCFYSKLSWKSNTFPHLFQKNIRPFNYLNCSDIHGVYTACPRLQFLDPDWHFLCKHVSHMDAGAVDTRSEYILEPSRSKTMTNTRHTTWLQRVFLE